MKKEELAEGFRVACAKLLVDSRGMTDPSELLILNEETARYLYELVLRWSSQSRKQPIKTAVAIERAKLAAAKYGRKLRGDLRQADAELELQKAIGVQQRVPLWIAGFRVFGTCTSWPHLPAVRWTTRDGQELFYGTWPAIVQSLGYLDQTYGSGVAIAERPKTFEELLEAESRRQFERTFEGPPTSSSSELPEETEEHPPPTVQASSEHSEPQN